RGFDARFDRDRAIAGGDADAFGAGGKLVLAPVRGGAPGAAATFPVVVLRRARARVGGRRGEEHPDQRAEQAAGRGEPRTAVCDLRPGSAARAAAARIGVAFVDLPAPRSVRAGFARGGTLHAGARPS